MMNLKDIKQEVYTLTLTNTTKQLKKQRPDLINGRDLRYKFQWLEILEKVKLLRSENIDISLADLEASDIMLKESLFKVGRLAGLTEIEIETDWQRIQLEAQFSDIHIEELE